VAPRSDARRNAGASTEQALQGLRRTKLAPLSASDYRVVFTASERLKQKLDRARELMSHGRHPADLPALLERALDLLIAREERRRFGAKRSSGQERSSNAYTCAEKPEARAAQTTNPGATSVHVSQSRTTKPCVNENHDVVNQDNVGHGSGYIRAAVRRGVWERDAGQCT
jgi:hypothetical protein